MEFPLSLFSRFSGFTFYPVVYLEAAEAAIKGSSERLFTTG
jgi:hypothetical protein